jgi:hypothetical protein
MTKLKKAMSVVIFIIAITIYSLLVMVILTKINFNHWLIEFIVYFLLGILWVFPSMYILKPFKKR